MSGIYDYENALKTYETIISIAPKFPLAYRGKASILYKLNKLDDLLIWLKKLKRTKYYKVYHYVSPIGQKITDDYFVSTIDDLIDDTEYKIKNHITYKPKKRK